VGKNCRVGYDEIMVLDSGAAFRRLLPPSVAVSRGAVELECEIERKGRLARTYFRFGKWGNKLLN